MHETSYVSSILPQGSFHSLLNYKLFSHYKVPVLCFTSLYRGWFGYASINGSGTFRGDPHVWNGHFRKTSVPHVWNGVNWIMIISVYATSKASNDFALATKLFLHQVRFHGTVWNRSGTVWNRSGTVWNEVWNGMADLLQILVTGRDPKCSNWAAAKSRLASRSKQLDSMSFKATVQP